MKIIERKANNGAELHTGIKTYTPTSVFAATANSENEGNFKFGLINGALLVAPFWLIILWLILHT